MVAAVAYGLGGVLNEKFSEGMTNKEYLEKMSIAPLIACAILFFCLEIKIVVNSSWEGVVLTATFSVCMVLFYFSSIRLLQISNAVFFNTSLILTNVFTFPISIFLFKQKIAWYQVLCAALIVTSIIAYIIFQDRRVKAIERQMHEPSNAQSEE